VIFPVLGKLWLPSIENDWRICENGEPCPEYLIVSRRPIVIFITDISDCFVCDGSSCLHQDTEIARNVIMADAVTSIAFVNIIAFVVTIDYISLKLL